VACRINSKSHAGAVMSSRCSACSIQWLDSFLGHCRPAVQVCCQFHSNSCTSNLFIHI